MNYTEYMKKHLESEGFNIILIDELKIDIYKDSQLITVTSVINENKIETNITDRTSIGLKEKEKIRELTRKWFFEESKYRLDLLTNVKKINTTLDDSMFQVTRERIQQIEVKDLRKLRHPSRSQNLQQFLSE